MSVPTGIEQLDERLGGGVRSGSLTAITLPPGGEHLPLVCAGVRQQSAVVLTSLRSERLIATALDQDGVNTESVRISELDPGRAHEMLPQELDHLEDGTRLYVDPIGPVEKSIPTETYIGLINMVSRKLDQFGTAGYLFCYRDGDDTYNRIVTLDVADFVVEIERVRDSDRLAHRLVISKANGTTLNDSDRMFEMSLDREPE